jgi:hypothetical protein
MILRNEVGTCAENDSEAVSAFPFLVTLAA